MPTSSTRTITGRIKADSAGRIVIERDTSGENTTVFLRDDHAVRVTFTMEGRTTSACLELLRGEARGWEWKVWGEGLRIIAADSDHGSVLIEYSTQSPDRSLDVKVGEPFDGYYAIRKARAMLARCGDLLELWRDGGRPAAQLLSDLNANAYWTSSREEPEPDASIRTLIAACYADHASNEETIDAIAALIGGVEP